MRKIVSLFATAILCSVLVFAQTRTISGVVTDANGRPVPFATVTVKDTKNGVTADADGKYILQNVSSGAVLVITSVGYDDREVTVGASDVINVTMTVTAGTNLTEVVVTSAFGIKKAQRTTPFSSQVIKSDQLNIIPQTNVVEALAGKIAGVQTRAQSNAKLNSEDFLRIRGGLSLNDVGPIFVVDGTIVNSFDINPDDVEDVSVLKGANATALFGERAKGGAIVINTKKRGPRQGIGVELTQSVRFDNVYVLPKYQNQYAGGASPDLIQFVYDPDRHPAEWEVLDGKYYHDYTDDGSWGPRMSGQEYVPWYAWIPGHNYSLKTAPLLPSPNNARDFWETGMTTTTNAVFSKSGAGYSTRMSYTNQYIRGLLPYTNSKRNTVFFSGNIDMNEHFTSGVNVNYSTNTINGEFSDAYANNSSGSFNQWFHRNLDIKIMKELNGFLSPDGYLMSWNLRNNPNSVNKNSPAWNGPWDQIAGNYWYNFYDYFQNRPVLNGRDRFFGDFYLQYKLNSHFNVKATVRKNQLTTYTESIITSLLEKSAHQSGYLAGYFSRNTFYSEYNYEALANYNNTFLENLAVNVTAGGNILRTLYKDNSASTTQGLNIPDLYTVTNSVGPADLGNTRQASRVNSLFAAGDIEWNKFISATFALRNDWYSTLPVNDNSLFSPSAGLAFVFSEFTKTSLPWLSFGKVFGSWGKKPTSILIFQNNFGYSPAQNLWDGNFLMGTPNDAVDPGLTGSLITTYEAGFDLRFLKGRLGVNVVYYNEDNDKEPLRVPIDPVSGFTSLLVNSAKIRRQGVDVQINAIPVKGKNFTWELTKTFGQIIDNDVISLFGDQDRTLLAGGAFGTRFARAFQEKGSDWGQLIGGGIKRNSDGQVVVDPGTGLFVRDADKHWGSVVPKTTGGLINSFVYKDLVLNVSLDYQIGGKFFSLSENWGYFSGLLAQTADINDNGKNVRDPVANGGGVHVVGVSSVDEKTPVDMYVNATTYFQQFYFNQIAEPFIHDLTYVKIREASLGYRIPVKKLGNISKYIQNATISVITQNPWIIHRDAKNFDPAEISGVQGEDGQLPGTRSIGASLKLSF